MKYYSLLLVLLVIFVSSGLAQTDDSLFSRMSGIRNNGTDFYHIDGIEVSVQTQEAEFSTKNILKKFKRYPAKEKDLVNSNPAIDARNFHVLSSEQPIKELTQFSSLYFIENAGKGITAVTFTSMNKRDTAFEPVFIRLLLSNAIPAYVYESMQVDSIRFAGRKIGLGSGCRWMGVNNMQCPYYGQMNWSIHKTLEEAAVATYNQYHMIQSKKQGKIISKDSVNVVFEGNDVKALKTVYDFKGVTSLLVGMSGGKTLTIYFVTAPATKNFVSCVMSFWNNDRINPSGLPPLLEEVMKLNQE